MVCEAEEIGTMGVVKIDTIWGEGIITNKDIIGDKDMIMGEDTNQ